MTAVQYIEAEACGARKDVIDAFASKFAKDIGFCPGDPLDPVVAQLGGKIIIQSFNDLTKSGASIRIHGTGNFEIFLPDHTTVERDRFSIAHEIGHYVLHFPIKKMPMVAQRFGSNRVEWEANWFAAGFLMPRTDFAASFSGPPSLAAAARAFKVSTAAAEARARTLGLV